MDDGQIIIWNDHYAFKRIYYYYTVDYIVISTKIELLFNTSKINKNLAFETIVEHLSPKNLIDESGYEEGKTFYSGVNVSSYASVYTISYDTSHIKLDVKKYWQPPVRLRRDWTLVECVTEFKRIFLNILLNQLILFKGSKVGCEFSGGIDSGCIISCLLYLCKHNSLDYVIDTFTITSGTTTWESEKEKIVDLKNKYDNFVINFINIEGLHGYLEDSTILKSYHPTATPNRLNLPTALAKLVQVAESKNCKALFSGEGADWYLEGSDLVWDSLITQKKWRSVFSGAAQLFKRRNTRFVLTYLFKKAIIPSLPLEYSRRAYIKKYYASTLEKDIPDLFTNDFKEMLVEFSQKYAEQLLNNSIPFECWSQRLEYELMFPPNHNWQSINIENIDYILPYLDKRLIEFGLTVPPEYKFIITDSTVPHYGASKVLQRLAFKNIASDKIIESQHKSVYEAPIKRRVKESFNEILLNESKLFTLNIIDSKKAANLFTNYYLNEATSEEKRYHLESWLDGLIHLEKWLKSFDII